MTTIGLIGAGHIGSQIARLAVARGYSVVISNSRGPETLAAFAGAAPPNTDDHPRVAFAAPRFTARRDTRPAELLLALLDRCAADPHSFLAPASETFTPRLADYVAARDRYLRGLATEADGNLPEAIEAYLESTRRSLYFTPAYARLVNIIQVLAGADRVAAKHLFKRLQEAQPDQPLGQQLLGPLFRDEQR